MLDGSRRNLQFFTYYHLQHVDGRQNERLAPVVSEASPRHGKLNFSYLHPITHVHTDFAQNVGLPYGTRKM